MKQNKKIKGIKPAVQQTHGYDIHGNYHEFKVSHVLGTSFHARDKQLVKLVINEKAHDLFCSNNHLKYIIFNKPIVRVICNDNNLTHLKIPVGLKTLYCEGNKLSKLKVPNSLNFLRCDKELFDYDTCEILEVNISYE